MTRSRRIGYRVDRLAEKRQRLLKAELAEQLDAFKRAERRGVLRRGSKARLLWMKSLLRRMSMLNGEKGRYGVEHSTLSSKRWSDE